MGWETKYPGLTSIAYPIANLPDIASDDSADISDLMKVTPVYGGYNTHCQGRAFFRAAHYFYATPKGSCIELNQKAEPAG